MGLSDISSANLTGMPYITSSGNGSLLFGGKPLTEPLVTRWLLAPGQLISMKFELRNDIK